MRLIDPELIEAKELVPLTKLMDAVEQLPFEQQEAIAEELCAAQEAVYPPIARRIRAQLEHAKADGDFPIQLILAALSIGELTAHALRPATDSTYMVCSSYWHAFGSLPTGISLTTVPLLPVLSFTTPAPARSCRTRFA